MKNLRIIKCVAGAGKTTDSIKYLKEHSNGLYLAYTNSVVDDIKYKGYLSKTIDSLFLNYIIPKFINVIPIINKNSTIKYLDANNLKGYEKNILNISIDTQGNIYNQQKKTKFTLYTKNEDLIKSSGVPNQRTLLQIFQKKILSIPQRLLNDLSNFLIVNYEKEIKQIMEKRFSYVIIDEAQDLKDFREKFAQLLYDSNLDFIVLGDDNQNIINYGKWFESLEFNEFKNRSFRTSDNICKWIRENLNIDIYGNDTEYNYYDIDYQEIKKYDNGNRVLIYNKKDKSNEEIISKWKSEKYTIKSVKGTTIEKDIVIIGKSLSYRNLYTAITRTTKNVYCTIKKISR